MSAAGRSLPEVLLLGATGRTGRLVLAELLARGLPVRAIGPRNGRLAWVVVRPDTLRTGEFSSYALHESLVNNLARPGDTDRASVAHFMAELVTAAETWRAWAGKLPVIVNAPPQRGSSSSPST